MFNHFKQLFYNILAGFVFVGFGYFFIFQLFTKEKPLIEVIKNLNAYTELHLILNPATLAALAGIILFASGAWATTMIFIAKFMYNPQMTLKYRVFQFVAGICCLFCLFITLAKA